MFLGGYRGSGRGMDQRKTADSGLLVSSQPALSKPRRVEAARPGKPAFDKLKPGGRRRLESGSTRA